MAWDLFKWLKKEDKTEIQEESETAAVTVDESEDAAQSQEEMKAAVTKDDVSEEITEYQEIEPKQIEALEKLDSTNERDVDEVISAEFEMEKAMVEEPAIELAKTQAVNEDLTTRPSSESLPEKETIKKEDIQIIETTAIEEKSESDTSELPLSVESIENDKVNISTAEDEGEPEGNFFQRLKMGLQKTSENLTQKIDHMFKSYMKIDEDTYEELEEILITSDIGFDTTVKIVDTLRENVKQKRLNTMDEVRDELKLIVTQILDSEDSPLKIEPKPSIIVIIGVNGVGKTTTIGKLAHRLKQENHSVMLAAADTFRAAAAEQLKIWSERADVPIIAHQEGADPSAVIFDAIHAAKNRNVDVLICDTAGRLHNKKNLVLELGKIIKIIDREYPEATKEYLLVIDAGTGQNALNQATVFNEVVPLTGYIVTKLDGTAKGGVILSLRNELDLPIKFIGVGEQLDDLQEFDAQKFSEALFE